MEIKEITNQSFWDEFIIANHSQFLQSWDWGELQKNLGRQIWRLGVLENGKMAAAALVIKHQLPLGKNYLYSPHGPIIVNQKYFGELLAEIKNTAEIEKSIFFRFEPVSPLQLKAYNLQLTKPVQPKQTLILDLTKSIDELFAGLHQKTRYNIRLAEKHGVTVRPGQGDVDFEIFWDLLQKTYAKQGIKTHPKSYYQQIFKLQATSYKLQAKLYLAELKGQPLAANLGYVYGDTFTYTHGGSDYNYRQLMAPHLLQWQQIKSAKENGFKYYDFWGIDEKRWPGITRFKLGFGGREISYPGTFDLPLDKPWHQLYRLTRKILK